MEVKTKSIKGVGKSPIPESKNYFATTFHTKKLLCSDVQDEKSRYIGNEQNDEFVLATVLTERKPTDCTGAVHEKDMSCW